MMAPIDFCHADTHCPWCHTSLEECISQVPLQCQHSICLQCFQDEVDKCNHDEDSILVCNVCGKEDRKTLHFVKEKRRILDLKDSSAWQKKDITKNAKECENFTLPPAQVCKLTEATNDNIHTILSASGGERYCHFPNDGGQNDILDTCSEVIHIYRGENAFPQKQQQALTSRVNQHVYEGTEREGSILDHSSSRHDKNFNNNRPMSLPSEGALLPSHYRQVLAASPRGTSKGKSKTQKSTASILECPSKYRNIPFQHGSPRALPTPALTFPSILPLTFPSILPPGHKGEHSPDADDRYRNSVIISLESSSPTDRMFAAKNLVTPAAAQRSESPAERNDDPGHLYSVLKTLRLNEKLTRVLTSSTGNVGPLSSVMKKTLAVHFPQPKQLASQDHRDKSSSAQEKNFGLRSIEDANMPLKPCLDQHTLQSSNKKAKESFKDGSKSSRSTPEKSLHQSPETICGKSNFRGSCQTVSSPDANKSHSDHTAQSIPIASTPVLITSPSAERFGSHQSTASLPALKLSNLDHLKANPHRESSSWFSSPLGSRCSPPPGPNDIHRVDIRFLTGRKCSQSLGHSDEDQHRDKDADLDKADLLKQKSTPAGSSQRSTEMTTQSSKDMTLTPPTFTGSNQTPRATQEEALPRNLRTQSDYTALRDFRRSASSPSLHHSSRGQDDSHSNVSALTKSSRPSVAEELDLNDYTSKTNYSTVSSQSFCGTGNVAMDISGFRNTSQLPNSGPGQGSSSKVDRSFDLSLPSRWNLTSQNLPSNTKIGSVADKPRSDLSLSKGAEGSCVEPLHSQSSLSHMQLSSHARLPADSSFLSPVRATSHPLALLKETSEQDGGQLVPSNYGPLLSPLHSRAPARSSPGNYQGSCNPSRLALPVARNDRVSPYTCTRPGKQTQLSTAPSAEKSWGEMSDIAATRQGYHCSKLPGLYSEQAQAGSNDAEKKGGVRRHSFADISQKLKEALKSLSELSGLAHTTVSKDENATVDAGTSESSMQEKPALTSDCKQQYSQEVPNLSVVPEAPSNTSAAPKSSASASPQPKHIQDQSSLQSKSILEKSQRMSAGISPVPVESKGSAGEEQSQTDLSGWQDAMSVGTSQLGTTAPSPSIPSSSCPQETASTLGDARPDPLCHPRTLSSPTEARLPREKLSNSPHLPNLSSDQTPGQPQDGEAVLRKSPAPSLDDEVDPHEEEEVQSGFQDDHSSVSLMTNQTINCSCEAILDAFHDVLRDMPSLGDKPKVLGRRMSDLKAVTCGRMLSKDPRNQRPMNHDDCLLYDCIFNIVHIFITQEGAKARNEHCKIRAAANASEKCLTPGAIVAMPQETSGKGEKNRDTLEGCQTRESASNTNKKRNEQRSYDLVKKIRQTVMKGIDKEMTHQFRYLTKVISEMTKIIKSSPEPFEEYRRCGGSSKTTRPSNGLQRHETSEMEFPKSSSSLPTHAVSKTKRIQSSTTLHHQEVSKSTLIEETDQMDLEDSDDSTQIYTVHQENPSSPKQPMQEMQDEQIDMDESDVESSCDVMESVISPSSKVSEVHGGKASPENGQLAVSPLSDTHRSPMKRPRSAHSWLDTQPDGMVGNSSEEPSPKKRGQATSGLPVSGKSKGKRQPSECLDDALSDPSLRKQPRKKSPKRQTAVVSDYCTRSKASENRLKAAGRMEDTAVQQVLKKKKLACTLPSCCSSSQASVDKPAPARSTSPVGALQEPTEENMEQSSLETQDSTPPTPSTENEPSGQKTIVRSSKSCDVLAGRLPVEPSPSTPVFSTEKDETDSKPRQRSRSLPEKPTLREGHFRPKPLKYPNECFHILNTIFNHDLGEPFHEEVKSAEVEGYYTVIKRGMFLRLVAYKLRRAVYSNLEHYVADMRLIFRNALTFYQSDHSIYKAATAMKALLEAKLIEKFPNMTFDVLLLLDSFRCYPFIKLEDLLVTE